MKLSKTTSRVTLGTVFVAAYVVVATSSWTVEPAPAEPIAHEAGEMESTSQRLKGGLIECASPNPELAHELARDIARSLANRASRASMVLYDRTTDTSCAYGADKHYDSASIVKPIILGALLLARSDHLSEDEQELAREMIVSSDNDATYTLWDSVGTENIQEFLDKAGMEDTILDEAGLMGLTQVTARDQATLLELLTGEDNSVLNAEERAYILGLMRNVQEDQRWGAPAGAPSGAAVQVKNGWLQRSERVKDPWDSGDWKVNSMGAFTGRAYDYGLVVLTENNRVPEGESPGVGWDYGMETIERVAKAVHRDLYPDRTPAAAGSPGRR
ncbi:class A beta-lactamase-related serine hydrolase [Streptomyces sp. NBC_00390]|uniref:serine hydrolase n=1 Tax=Streptomyces sp. NBC_00390 TaxID=2975736 RepID=UPI002E208F36